MIENHFKFHYLTKRSRQFSQTTVLSLFELFVSCKIFGQSEILIEDLKCDVHILFLSFSNSQKMWNLVERCEELDSFLSWI